MTRATRDRSPEAGLALQFDGDLARVMRRLAGRRWKTPVAALAAELGIDHRQLTRVVMAAEQVGLIRIWNYASGTQVRLTRLGTSLLRPKYWARHEVATDALGEDRWAEVLAAVASWPTLVVDAQALADQLGRDVVGLWDELTAAEQAGWVELWPDAPAGPAATLSPLSAGRLGLSPSSDGSIWLRRGEPDPTTIDGIPVEFTEADLGDPLWDGPGLFATIPDPQALEGPESLVLAERADASVLEVEAMRAERRDAPPLHPKSAWHGDAERREEDKLPKPLLLLGLGLAWPTVPRADGSCPGCRGQFLPIIGLCLVCHRSGLDGILPKAEPLPLDKPAAKLTRKQARKKRKAAS